MTGRLNLPGQRSRPAGRAHRSGIRGQLVSVPRESARSKNSAG